METAEKEKWIRELASTDSSTRQSALESLGEVDDLSGLGPELIRVLDDEDETVRELANSALESIHESDPQTTASLIQILNETLTDESKSDLAYWAVTLLGLDSNPANEIVDALNKVVDQAPTSHLRRRAERILARNSAEQ